MVVLMNPDDVGIEGDMRVTSEKQTQVRTYQDSWLHVVPACVQACVDTRRHMCAYVYVSVEAKG